MWMDPTTGESFIVDTASGNSRHALGPGKGIPRRTLASVGQDDIVQEEMPSWIGDALTVCYEIDPAGRLTEIPSR